MLIRRMSDRRLRVSTNDFNDPSSNALYLRRASAMSVYSIASSYAETARQASRGVAVVLQIVFGATTKAFRGPASHPSSGQGFARRLLPRSFCRPFLGGRRAVAANNPVRDIDEDVQAVVRFFLGFR